MARNTAPADTKTYFPEGHEAEIVDFVQALADRGIVVPTAKAALVGQDNTRIELPDQLHAVLVQVAEAPSAIQGTVREIKAGRVFVDFTSPSPAIKPGLTAQVRIKVG